MVIEEYEEAITSAALSFCRHPVTRHTMAAIASTSSRVREDFIYRNPDYVARGEVIVTENEGAVHVSAPICTRAEAYELDRAQEQAGRVYAQLQKDCDEARVRQRKSAANMARLHRRLMRRHGDSIPPGTASIWQSLTMGQQYAILKDIDFNVRHARKLP